SGKRPAANYAALSRPSRKTASSPGATTSPSTPTWPRPAASTPPSTTPTRSTASWSASAPSRAAKSCDCRERPKPSAASATTSAAAQTELDNPPKGHTMQYYIVIPDQDLRDRIGPAAAGPEGRGLVLSTDTWVPEADRDWTVTVTWTDTHDKVHVHLE